MEFDGIDLEDLANSESAVVEGLSTESDESVGNEETTNSDSEESESALEGLEPIDGIDLDDLAEISEELPGSEDTVENVGEKDIKDSANDTATSSSQNTFTSLASALKEAGSFIDLTDEDLASVTDADSLLVMMEKQMKNNEFANLNDNQKQYLEALELGIPHEQYATAKTNSDQYEKVSDEDIFERPELAQELIKRSFLIKGFDNDKASKYAALATKGDSFQEDAVDARDALVAYENNRLEKEINTRKQSLLDDETKAQEALSKLKSTVNETSEVIPGMKVNSRQREQIFASMTTPTKVKGDTPLNAVMEKYENDQEYKMRLHALDVMTKGFTDFSKFKKTATTSAAKKLEKQLAQQGIMSGNSMKDGGVVSTSQLDMKNALDNLKL